MYNIIGRPQNFVSVILKNFKNFLGTLDYIDRFSKNRFTFLNPKSLFTSHLQLADIPLFHYSFECRKNTPPPSQRYVTLCSPQKYWHNQNLWFSWEFMLFILLPSTKACLRVWHLHSSRRQTSPHCIATHQRRWRNRQAPPHYKLNPFGRSDSAL